MTSSADPAPGPDRRPSALDPLAPATDRSLRLRWRERGPAAQPAPDPAEPSTSSTYRGRPRLGLRWARDPSNPYRGTKGG